jgi:hypothetical protein
MAAGALHSGLRLSFRPHDSKFLTLQTGDVMTKAMMCGDCGVIEIVGDIAKLKRLISGTGPVPATLAAARRGEAT